RCLNRPARGSIQDVEPLLVEAAGNTPSPKPGVDSEKARETDVWRRQPVEERPTDHVCVAKLGDEKEVALRPFRVQQQRDVPRRDQRFWGKVDGSLQATEGFDRRVLSVRDLANGDVFGSHQE